MITNAAPTAPAPESWNSVTSKTSVRRISAPEIWFSGQTMTFTAVRLSRYTVERRIYETEHPPFRLIESYPIDDKPKGARWEIWASRSTQASAGNNTLKYYPSRYLLVRVQAPAPLDSAQSNSIYPSGENEQTGVVAVMEEALPGKEYAEYEKKFRASAEQHAKEEREKK